MSFDFFNKKNYCNNCILEKEILKGNFKRASNKNEIQIKSDIEDFSNIDVLFITDAIEQDEIFEKLFKLIKNKGIKNFAITSAIGCRTFKFELPKPLYKTYCDCKSFDINKFNPKCIVTFGKSLFHFTQSSIFSSWRDFIEIYFNETYFYPHINYKWKGRIYPTAFVQDLFIADSYEYLHFCKQLEFVKNHINNYKNEKYNSIDYNIIKVTDFDNWLENHKDKKIVALDTETNNLNVFVDDFRVGCIQLSFDGITAYYIPIDIINKRKFSIWLKDKYQIWANGKYDLKALNRIGIKNVKVCEDIPLIFHLMNTCRDSNSIKLLSWFIGFGGYEDELEIYKKKYRIDDYLKIPENILIKYAGLDAIVTYRLYEYLHKYLVPKQKDIYDLYKKIIIAVIPVMQSMEEEGILINKEYIIKYKNKLLETLNNIKLEIYKIANKQFNISSNDELGQILEELKLPNYGRVKKGFYQTNEEILLKWEKDGYLIAKKINEYRKIMKLYSTYVGEDKNIIEKKSFFDLDNKEKISEGIYQYITSDNRIHGTIMPALTDSWRSLSFSPNLQNFPKQGAEGKDFRKIFIAPKDYLICEADYSGFQLRLMGIYSKDETMIDAFVKHNGDLHSLSAQEIFCNNVSLEYFMEHKKEEPYKTARFNGKTANLAFAFCQSAYSFQNKIKEEWSDQQIDEYINNNKLEIIYDKNTNIQNKFLTVATYIQEKYFKKYKNLLPYATKMQKFAMQNGYVDCPIFKGARRHLPELTKISLTLSKEKSSHYSNLKNIAVNTGAQAGEAIIMYKSLVKIYNKIKELNLKSKMISCVHDSICFYIHKSEIKLMYNLIKENMENYDYSIPIVCEIEMGNIWGFSPELTLETIKDKEDKELFEIFIKN